jgi:hypothetical protein
MGVENKKMTKLRVIMSVVYEARSEDYDTDDPLKMAKIDQDNFMQEPENILLMDGFEVKVEPVEE